MVFVDVAEVDGIECVGESSWHIFVVKYVNTLHRIFGGEWNATVRISLVRISIYSVVPRIVAEEYRDNA